MSTAYVLVMTFAARRRSRPRTSATSHQAYRRQQKRACDGENVRLLRNQAQIILAPGQE
jgi:hypothetical protein